MISEEELRVIARRLGVSVGVAEREYATDWLLKGIYSSGLARVLVFKGATAIRKVYYPSIWRLSYDIDMTCLRKVDRSDFEGVFELVGSESGISFRFKSFHEAGGAVIARVQFLGPLGFWSSFRLDLTLDEELVTEPEWRVLRSAFSDVGKFKVRVYSLEEILAEKVRSIAQRGKSRDYFDTWLLLRTASFNTARLRRIIKRKFEAKGVELSYDRLFGEERLREARRFWERGLKELVREELPVFDRVVDELREKLRDLI